MNPERRARSVFWWSAAGLALFLVWQAWALHAYIVADARPPAWDQANHLEVAWKYFNAAAAGRWADIWRYAPNGTMPPFPPLYHLALALVYNTANPAGNALWVNWFYLALLAVSVFGLTREFRQGGAGLAAAVLLCCSPVVQNLLHTQLADLALAAVTAAAYWALVRSEGFTRWKGSLAFGAAFAVGLLHKWSFFTYMFPAFYIGARALLERSTRGRALAAAAIGFGFGLPWYLIRFPLVVIRLTQATNDFVVPFWKGAAFFQYFRWLPAQLGWLLLGMACVGAVSFRRDRRMGMRLVLLWALTSYVFWALIPNRQMRFLMPGLSGLAVVAAAACPQPLVWFAAALQVVSAFTLSPIDRPAREDWKIPEVLHAVEASAAGGPSLAAVSVIVNDERFNKLDFIWYADTFGYGDIQFRGVHDIPWELSPFVIWKTGRLGPDVVVTDFAQAQAEILKPDGWFARGFEVRGRWPLPDGSDAVLFGRRRMSAPPFRARRVSLPLYSSLPLEIPRADVEFGAWDAKSGCYRRVAATAPVARLRGLEATGLRLELENAVLVPDRDGARLLSVGKVSVESASVGAETVRAFLERAGVRVKSLTLDGTARAALSVKGVPLSGALSAETGDAARRCRLGLESVQLGPLPMPPALLLRDGANGPLLDAERTGDRTVLRTVFGLTRTLPFPVELPGCAFRGGRFSIP